MQVSHTKAKVVQGESQLQQTIYFKVLQLSSFLVVLLAVGCHLERVLWYPYHHSPRETCTRGILPSFKKENKRGGWNLGGLLITLSKGKCNTRLPATHKYICT
jgi:hypothetical protein